VGFGKALSGQIAPSFLIRAIAYRIQGCCQDSTYPGAAFGGLKPSTRRLLAVRLGARPILSLMRERRSSLIFLQIPTTGPILLQPKLGMLTRRQAKVGSLKRGLPKSVGQRSIAPSAR
jgi:hypothetical protein